MKSEVRERRQLVLDLILRGVPESDIADELSVALATVRRDVRQMLASLLEEENRRRGGDS